MTALVDSGSSHCFIDPAYVALHKIPAVPIPHPIPLRLFDGSLGQTITQVVTEFSIHFSSGDILSLTFYVTPLDSSCSVVLGYSWLTHYNPGINWVLRRITYHPMVLQKSSSTTFTGRSASMDPAPTSVSPTPLLVSLVNAEVFLQATKLAESQSFRIHLSDFSEFTSTRKANLAKDPIDLSNIPFEYHEFTNVFSESRANTLAPH